MNEEPRMADAFLLKLGEQLRARRLAANVRMEDICLKTGLSKQAIIRIEHGRGGSLRSLAQILEVLGFGEEALNALAPQATFSPRLLLKTKNRQPRRAGRKRTALTAPQGPTGPSATGPGTPS